MSQALSTETKRQIILAAFAAAGISACETQRQDGQIEISAEQPVEYSQIRRIGAKITEGLIKVALSSTEPLHFDIRLNSDGLRSTGKSSFVGEAWGKLGLTMPKDRYEFMEYDQGEAWVDVRTLLAQRGKEVLQSNKHCFTFAENCSGGDIEVSITAQKQHYPAPGTGQYAAPGARYLTLRFT